MNTAKAGPRVSMRPVDQALAHGLLRAAVGFDLVMHAVARFITGPEAFAAQLGKMFHATPLPSSLVHDFGVAVPFVELALGALLLLGLRTRVTLIANVVWMLMLMFGTALAQNWDVVTEQLVYVFVYALLLATASWDRFSLDAWWQRTHAIVANHVRSGTDSL